MGLFFGQNREMNDLDGELLIDRILLDGGSLTDNEKLAWRTFVTSAKSNSYYTKLLAIYPLIGGTLATCKYNGLRPEDSDEAFRLTYTATPDVSSNGLSFDGTSGKGICLSHIIPQGHGMSYTEGGSIFFYSRTDNVSTEYSAGMYSSPSGFWLAPTLGPAFFASGGPSKQDTVQDMTGLHYGSRDSFSTIIKAYRNTTKYNEDLVNTFAGYFKDKINDVVAFGGMREAPSTNYYSQQEFALFGCGLDMTDAEYLLMEADILIFQTTLGRNV